MTAAASSVRGYMTVRADKTNGFACFLVGIIADFSDRKEDDVCYKFLLIFAIFLNLELKYMQTCRIK